MTPPLGSRRLALLIATSLGLVVGYVLLLVPSAFALLAISRPASSLDNPPGLVGLFLVLLVVVAASAGAYLRFGHGARISEVCLVALVACIAFAGLDQVRSVLLAEQPFSLLRLTEGFGLLLTIVAPALLVGAWVGARARLRWPGSR